MSGLSVAAFSERIKGMNNRELAGLAAISPAFHFAAFVQITDKQNRLIVPRPNILQLRMSQVYEQCQAWGIPCRMLVAKPRQVGCSTFAAHVVYHHEMRYRSNGLTVADVADNSKGLMKKVADYSQRDRFPWSNRLKAFAQRLEFSNGSEHHIDSAENWKAGISKTRQVFHASEIGKWPKTGVKEDKRVMAAILPSIAKRPNTVVIAEGTPDGAVGFLYDQWWGKSDTGQRNSYTLEEVAEMRRKGTCPGIVWIRVFAAWFEFAEHAHDGKDGRPSLTTTERSAIKRSLTDRERRGQRLYGWTIEQIAWRRAVLATECGGNEDVLDEYYPEDDDSMFQASGRPRFNIGALKTLDRMTRGQQPECGNLMLDPERRSANWIRDPDGGDIQVWEHPTVGCRYLVACDPMTGIDQTQGSDPDRHSIQVLRAGYTTESGIIHNPRVVARVRPPFQAEGDEVAGRIIGLSRHYGNCLVVLEVNMGLHVLELLKFEGVPIHEREVFSARVGQKIRQLGFKLTNRDERRAVVEILATAIRTMTIDIPCPHIIEECKAFVTSVNGKDEARAGAHDDDVLCLAMGLEALSAATTYRESPRRRREPRDRKDWRVVGDHRA